MAEHGPMSVIRKKYQKAKVIVTEATKSFVGLVKSGGKKVSPETLNKRLLICQSCEQFNGHTCKICKCRINWKAILEVSSCPIKKW